MKLLVDKMSQIKTIPKQTLERQQHLKTGETFLGRKVTCFTFIPAPSTAPNHAVHFDHPFVFLPLWSGLC